jgi:uncharacterized protein
MCSEDNLVEMGTAPGSVSRPELRSLDPRVRAVWRLGWLMRSVFLTGAVVLALRLLEPPVPERAMVAGLLAVMLLLTVFWPAWQYRYWGFQVRGSDVFLQHGVLWRTTSVVPHGRIQHVDTQQGPLERAFGLSSVVMFTAGTVGAAIGIPGLSTADAEALREGLAMLSGSDDAV